MEVKEYIFPIRKWWWLILSATLLAGVASFIIARQQPDNYRARTTLMIGRAIDNPNPSGTEFWLTQQLAQTYAEIASREPIREGTMEALGLTWLPFYAVNVIPETQLVEIAVTDTSPERAQAVANELARQLIWQSPTNTEQDEQSRRDFINSQLDDLEIKITETQDDIAEKQEELTNIVSARQIADTQSQIAALQNKLNILQSNYANLLANTEKGAINTLTIIEQAALPRTPVGPNMGTSVFVAIAIGFTLSTGAAYLLEYLDDTVSTTEHVTRVTSLPTLAGIASIEEDEESGKLITLSKPRSPISEAYRILRTGINFSSVDNPEQRKLMVTSTNPSEGKSLTVANLAVVIAQAGNNVLIVDADLRRPVQHKLFRMPQRGGLTGMLLDLNLSGSEQEALAIMKRVVQPTSVEGLHVLTSGPIPPNPSELLGSAKMRIALATLARQYDFIIIDSPPVLAVTDASVLSRQTDGVLLVIDAGSTRRGSLKQATHQLKSTNAHILGVVLNRLSPRSDGYYSYYYYRHSYYLEESEDSNEEKPSSNGKSRTSWRRRQASREDEIA